MAKASVANLKAEVSELRVLVGKLDKESGIAIGHAGCTPKGAYKNSYLRASATRIACLPRFVAPA